MRAGRYAGSSTGPRRPARAGRGRGNERASGTGSPTSLLLPSAADDETRRIELGVRPAKGGDHALPSPLDGTQIHEEDLIRPVIDDPRQQMPAAREIRLRELALADRILQVIPEPAHRLVDLG